MKARGKWLLPLALLAVALPGCGGGDAGSGTATVKAKELPGYGSVLVTGDDKPLYLLTSDPKGGTECTGECAEHWRPLTAAGDPSAGEGAQGGMVGAFEREDGGRQVLYNGHALYTYERANAGMGAGAGVKWQDGTWFLMSPEGAAITTTAVGGY